MKFHFPFVRHIVVEVRIMCGRVRVVTEMVTIGAIVEGVRFHREPTLVKGNKRINKMAAAVQC